MPISRPTTGTAATPSPRQADPAHTGKMGAQAPDEAARAARRYDALRPNPDGPQYEEGAAYQGTRQPPTTTPRAEDGLAGRVHHHLRHSGYAVSDVDVQAQDGWVRLDGSVADHATRQAVHGCVLQCTGVQGVENHLRVARDPMDQPARSTAAKVPNN